MSDYILSTPLERAVEIAIYLDKPLLLCGEPGTGKTTLAKHLSEKYSTRAPDDIAPFYKEPLIFNTKTTSVATDLFYSYDALARLRDAYSQVRKNAGEYIELRALGKGICMKHGADARSLDAIREIRDFSNGSDIPRKPTSSIVLIDEIDKAPRDFPNDILNEIEDLQFEIRELNAKVPKVVNDARILVIMTSNNEKNLPDAFLRRCIFHYIDFPSTQLMQDIVRSHFKEWNNNIELAPIIEKFNSLRKLPSNKKPATAEFIDWLRILDKNKLLDAAKLSASQLSKEQAGELDETLGILYKSKIDISQAQEALKQM